jgi:broad specificity phosphatase PhoE
MVRLILFRHGLSRDNLKKRYSGFRDTPLHSKAGPRLEAIKNRLRKFPIDKVYCSDLRRSYVSARIVFGERQCPILKRRALRELNFGIWDGLTYKQVLTRYGNDYSKWLKNPFTRDIPRGEKISVFILRVKKAVRSIISANQNKTVALVSHLGALRVILNNFLEVKPEDFWKLKLGPDAIYVIELNTKLKASVKFI